MAGHGRPRALFGYEGIALQVIYPSIGIIWEGEVDDPLLADGLCRAYNRWAFELVSGHRDRLFPAAHISLRDTDLAVKEMRRVAAHGGRTAFVAAMPIKGKSFGHPDFDPIWAAAEESDIAIGLHLVSHRHYTGSDFYRDPKPGLMYFSMNLIQDPRQAVTTMVVDGVFERSRGFALPRLRRWWVGSANGLSVSIIVIAIWATPLE